ncbi:hypothetical protein FD733_02240 [Pantoea sp. Eser]|nr:hypothetical protein [Pantoea sp. Eser]
MLKSFKWVEVGGDIPSDVLSTAYETGAGRVICAVCEVDEALQGVGFPRLVWAYLDMDYNGMICRNTGQDISQYVVRWLPVDGAA